MAVNQNLVLTIVNSNALYKCKDQSIGGWTDRQMDGWMDGSKPKSCVNYCE